MRYLNRYDKFIILENSKNDPIPEITEDGKLGIVLIGAPGIGKSTFAKNYITHRNQNIKIFSTDDVSLTLTKDPEVYRRGASQLNLKKLSLFINSGGSFIYDTTGLQKENVSNLTNTARDNGYKIIYIHLMGTLDLSLKQNSQRERNVPENVIKDIYSHQFKNMRYFSSLNPDSYYIVYNIDGKYKFMKYDGNKLLKRKVDRYIPLNENLNKEFTIKDVYLSAVGVIDSGFVINFYDSDENYLGTDDIDSNNDKFKNFEITKKVGNNITSEFTLEVTNKNNSISFDEFSTIISDMSVTIQDIENKGWILKDFFASPDDDSEMVHKFYQIRFVFGKDKVKISQESLQKAYPENLIRHKIDNLLDTGSIKYYDDYIEIEYDDFGMDKSELNSTLSLIVKKLGANDYDFDYNFIKIYF